MKLSIKTKIGYAFACFSDSAAYTLTGTYLLFFLTTVVGINPAVAGTVTAVGSLFNIFSSPIIGYISDHAKNKMGRRRPYLLFSAVPLGIMCMLIFTPVDCSTPTGALYYAVVIVIFWIVFNLFFNPYMAMGAELSSDYDERSSLRTATYIFDTAGTIAGMVLPNMIVSGLEKNGISAGRSWSMVGAVIGTLIAIFILLTFFMTKDCAHTESRLPHEKISIRGMIDEYKSIFKLKPLIFLMLAGLFFLCGCTMGDSVRIYYLTYNMALPQNKITWMMLFASLINIASVFLIYALSKRYGKKQAFIIVEIAMGIMIACARIVGIASIGQMLAFMVLYSLSATGYWLLMPSMIYDVCEVDELKNGRRREGMISSAQCFVEAVSEAAGLQILGIILQFSGFNGDAAVQSAVAMKWIENIMTFGAAIFALLSALMVAFYPLTKEKYNEILDKLNKR